MPFIPHTEKDIAEMLQTIGINRVEALFDEIPDSLRHVSLETLPKGLSEMELGRLMRERAQKDGDLLCFIGAGAYEHHIPAAVWQVATRGEFYTAYTPYQAEASQGSLQLIYEYQTMMSNLMGMEVSNASLYDGASALAEAVLMVARLSGKKAYTRILVPDTLHPLYQQGAGSILAPQGIELLRVPYDPVTGRTNLDIIDSSRDRDIVGLVIPQPNFFGLLEDVDAMTNYARTKNLYSIAVVNPMSMALLKPPGEWGEKGADIVCGEGQPLGIPLASGGPYYGFLCTRKSLVRQMPGRIAGKTIDADGRTGYVLTLQAREQHIRRAKATSNICTNQGLMVTASTIYMSLLGPEGLRQTALCSHENTRQMLDQLLTIKGVELVFETPFFHECVIRLPKSTDLVLHELAKHRIQAGIALDEYYPAFKNCLLLCATETKTAEDIARLTHHLRAVLENGIVEGDKVA